MGFNFKWFEKRDIWRVGFLFGAPFLIWAVGSINSEWGGWLATGIVAYIALAVFVIPFLKVIHKSQLAAILFWGCLTVLAWQATAAAAALWLLYSAITAPASNRDDDDELGEFAGSFSYDLRYNEDDLYIDYDELYSTSAADD